MAKPRTPPPPRKVQVPKQRRSPHQPGYERKRLYWLLGVTGVAAIAVGIGLAIAFGKGDSRGFPAAPAALKKAGCNVKTSPAAAATQHLSNPNEKAEYSTFPAVSGRHNNTPSVWGDYTQPVDPRQAVHNQEHGGIVVWYGTSISPETRQQITDWYDKDPNGVLVTPLEEPDTSVKYPKHQPLGSKIALTAWVVAGQVSRNVIAICPRYDEAAFEAFRDTYRGRGPEPFDVNDLRPGGF